VHSDRISTRGPAGALMSNSQTTRSDNLYTIPEDLPVPVDDRACRHLQGMTVPDLWLPSTKDRHVSLPSISAGLAVVFCYPRTGEPHKDPPSGWNQIPGARGCTPEMCSFRDHHGALKELGAEVFGLSTQSTEYQREMTERLAIPFEVLSDEKREFIDALDLPTFVVAGMTLVKRLTLILEGGRIEHVFYPIFPPHTHAADVTAWLQSRLSPGSRRRSSTE
jgi:peroxiredoxin